MLNCLHFQLGILFNKVFLSVAFRIFDTRLLNFLNPQFDICFKLKNVLLFCTCLLVKSDKHLIEIPRLSYLDHCVICSIQVRLAELS